MLVQCRCPIPLEVSVVGFLDEGLLDPIRCASNHFFRVSVVGFLDEGLLFIIVNYLHIILLVSVVGFLDEGLLCAWKC